MGEYEDHQQGYDSYGKYYYVLGDFKNYIDAKLHAYSDYSNERMYLLNPTASFTCWK